MALWSSGWKWSDGTKWVDGNARRIQTYSSFIDRSAYFISAKIIATSTGALTAPSAILNLLAEIGVRPQLPSHYEAFIDRNEETQHIAVAITQSFPSGSTDILTTEDDISLITEDSEEIGVELTTPFVINRIHGLLSQRSHVQPVG